MKKRIARLRHEAGCYRYECADLVSLLEREAASGNQRFVEKRATLVLSEAILDELTRKLHHKKFAAEIEESSLAIEAIVTGFRHLTDIALPADVPEDAVRDPKDQMILACAVGGKADVIISGDKDLLVLKAYQDIPIVTPSEFLNISLE